MDESNWLRLIALLRQNKQDEMALQCLHALRDENGIGILPSSPVLTKDMYNINVVRAEMSHEPEFQDADANVHGYDKLVEALASEPDTYLYMYIVAIRNVWFTIFTNTQTSRLVGIHVDRSERPSVHASDYAEGKGTSRTEEHRAKYISDQAELRRARQEANLSMIE